MQVAPKKIQLKNHQISHYQKTLGLTKKYGIVYDYSPTGSGKTIISILTAIELGVKLFVICPKTMISVWHDESQKYGVNIICISYTMLSGKNGILRHPYLIYNNGEYLPTSELEKVYNEGTLFIFDEAQKAKNPKSLCMNACAAISKYVVLQNKYNNKIVSSIRILSATLFDKVQFCESALKIMGIITINKLYHFNPEDLSYDLNNYGYNECLDHCKLICPNNKVCDNLIKIDAKNIIRHLYEVFNCIIVPFYGSSMSKPILDVNLYLYNGMFNMSEKDTENLLIGINSLLRSIGGYDEKILSNKININWGELTYALMKIEQSKWNMIYRLTVEYLNKYPNCKILLFVWYKSTVKFLYNKLMEYGAIILNGDIKTQKERTENIRNFNESSLKYRVAIIHPSVGGVGLSLDDINGNFPRYSFILPNYSIIDIHQCAGRTYRTSTKSDSHVYIVYGKINKEKSIMNSLMRKKMVLQDISTMNNDIMYPPDYPLFIEE